MAKKRQRKTVYKPPAQKLETQFNCPECGRKKVVEVRFNKKENKGYLRCKACREAYDTKLKRASTPIDIYYEWINNRDREKEKEEGYDKQINEEGGDEYEEGEENEIQEENQDNEYDNENENDNDNEEQSQEKDEDYNEDDDSDY